jgi:SAM-dependent methyltransferase
MGSAADTNPVLRIFHHLLQQRLLAMLALGARVLEIGCGCGEDALVLAAAGREVVGCDVSPERVERARDAARRLDLPPGRARFEVCAAEEAHSLGDGFDGAYASSRVLARADLAAAGAALARALRSGAPVLLSCSPPWPLPATLGRAVTGSGTLRARTQGQPGVALPRTFSWPGDLRRALGDAFEWRRGFALGVLLPGPEQSSWVADHPLTFASLATFEGLVRSWPVLRSLGDRAVIEGTRR